MVGVYDDIDVLVMPWVETHAQNPVLNRGTKTQLICSINLNCRHINQRTIQFVHRSHF